jgi:hypothetical protein
VSVRLILSYSPSYTLATFAAEHFRYLVLESEMAEVKRHYQSLETFEARNAYVQERVLLLSQIEQVCEFLFVGMPFNERNLAACTIMRTLVIFCGIR